MVGPSGPFSLSLISREEVGPGNEFSHMSNDPINHVYVMNPNKNSGHQISGKFLRLTIFVHIVIYHGLEEATLCVHKSMGRG